jgi:1-deoxy-D-xylulose-5-phosphate synthase
MVQWALRQPGPVAIRYARSKAPTIGPVDGRDVTHGELLRAGTDACLLAVGPVIAACLNAAELLREDGYSIAVADARLVKPLDGSLLERIQGMPIITVEENSIVGGLGSAVLEHFEWRGALDDLRLRRLGFPDAFINHMTRDEQLADIGLDVKSISASVRDFLGARVRQPVR